MCGVGLVVAVMLSGAVQAQTVYRCGNQYSQTPCAQAVVVDVADPRSVAQAEQGRQVAERERRLAEAMRQDRLNAAYAAAYAPAISLGGREPRQRGPRTRLIAFGALPEDQPYP